MPAISIAISNGNDGFRNSDFTVGVLAPGSNDFEFRFNTTDANGNVTTRKDILIALKAIERAVLTDAQIINPPGL